jgi:hypothetical protein
MTSETYTVIGIHDGGTENRYAESFTAESASDAEAQALCAHPDLLIAGVAAGSVQMVDDDPSWREEVEPA